MLGFAIFGVTVLVLSIFWRCLSFLKIHVFLKNDNRKINHLFYFSMGSSSCFHSPQEPK